MGKAVNGRPARLARLVGATAMACVLAATLLPADTTRAQMLGSSASVPQGEQMLLEADNLVFDRDKNTITAAGNVQIEFFQYTNPVPKPVERLPACDGGIRHICFDVTDIMAEYRRLKDAGVEFESEPQYLKAKVCSVYARDPDGNIVEFQEIFEGSPVERVAMPPRT